MNQQIFATDYGTLSHRFFSTGSLTNPTELIQSRELTALLYLCGVGEAELGDRASDYEKFKALCHSFPLLDGHPLKEQITVFLKKHFQGHKGHWTAFRQELRALQKNWTASETLLPNWEQK